MKLFKSSKGDINTETYWRKELEKFWNVVGEKGCPGHRKDFSEPVDSWDRWVRVLQLVEVQGEENTYNTAHSYNGVF
jgi:hypothetical protein